MENVAKRKKKKKAHDSEYSLVVIHQLLAIVPISNFPVPNGTECPYMATYTPLALTSPSDLIDFQLLILVISGLRKRISHDDVRII